MDPRLEQRLGAEAQGMNLRIDKSFIRHLDSYVDRFFPEHSTDDQLVVQTYLADAGLRIAKSEGKQVAELDDAKGAIYYFHLPDDPDDPGYNCLAAGKNVLSEEQTRSRYASGRLLSHNLRSLLDQIK